MAREFEADLHIKVASVLPKEVGDYWKGVSDERTASGGPIFVWYVRTRTGTFARHCEADAINSAENAKNDLAKYQKKQQASFQNQIEDIMDGMLEYYENIRDIADELAMWANDYVAKGESDGK